jgi:hypothetical protein
MMFINVFCSGRINFEIREAGESMKQGHCSVPRVSSCMIHSTPRSRQEAAVKEIKDTQQGGVSFVKINSNLIK